MKCEYRVIEIVGLLPLHVINHTAAGTAKSNSEIIHVDLIYILFIMSYKLLLSNEYSTTKLLD